MALEDLTGTKYIDDLNSSNPASGDVRSEGDDHLRGIKNVLKTTFPSITGPVTATQAELNILDGVTSTAAELNILDGVTATAAELNETDASAAAVTNYVSGLRAYIHNDSTHATSFDIATNIGATFETVGPTGSGATNIWAALDDLPSGAVAVTITLPMALTGGTTGDAYDFLIYARAAGSSTAVGARTRIGHCSFINRSAATEGDGSTVIVDIPVSASGIFEMATSEVGTAPSATCSMYLKGFIK